MTEEMNNQEMELNEGTLDINNEEELLTLFDEEGNEVLYRKLVNFFHPGFEKEYVILAEEGASDEEEIELIPMINIPDAEGEGGKFMPIETDEEWDMIEEFVNTNFDEEEL